MGPRAEGWSGLGLGVFVGGFWRGYLHVGLRVAATGKGRGPWKFWEGRGAGRRRPRGIRGSGTLLRMLGSGRAVRFPYREPGAPEGSKLAPATSPSCQARSPRCLRAGPGPLQVGTSALLHHELALLPSQTQTSNTESLCRPRPAWTGGETCSRSELGTRPPFPGFGPSSVRSLTSLCPCPTSYLSVKPSPRPQSPFAISLDWYLRVPPAAFILLPCKTSNSCRILVFSNFMSPRFSKCLANIDLIPHNNFVRELSLLSFINKESEKSNLPNITQLITVQNSNPGGFLPCLY